MPVLLQVHVKYGGLRHHIRDIDVSNYTGPQISEIIAKQHSLIDGCDCTIKRRPINVEAALNPIMEKLIKDKEVK